MDAGPHRHHGPLRGQGERPWDTVAGGGLVTVGERPPAGGFAGVRVPSARLIPGGIKAAPRRTIATMQMRPNGVMQHTYHISAISTR